MEVTNPPIETYQTASEAHRDYYMAAGPEWLSPPIAELRLDEVDASDMLSVASGVYFDKMTEGDPTRVERLNERLSHLRERDEGNIDYTREPEATVCIPVAAHDETAESIERTIEVLAKQDDASNIEILLYGNYPDTISDKEKAASEAKVDSAVQQFREQHPGVSLRSLTVGYSEQELGMGRVRKDYMDLVLADSQDRNFDFEHPVVWLDADTTGMSKNTVSALSENIKELRADALTVSSNVRFSVDGLKASGVAAANERDRVVAAQELNRRVLTRKGLIGSAYSQECGFSISLGVYTLLGGVNAGDAVNETTWLQAKLQNNYPKVREVTEKIRAAHGLDPSFEQPQLTSPVKEARIYTSARRQQNGVVDLADSGKYARLDDLYSTFDHTEGLRQKVREGNISRSAADQMIQDQLEYRRYGVNGNPRKGIAEAIMTRVGVKIDAPDN